MLLEPFNNITDNKDKFQIDNKSYTPTWDYYCECYSYVLYNIFEEYIKYNYAVFNSRHKPILFLIRHYIELCLKRNLILNTIPSINSHNLDELIKAFGTTNIVPIKFKNLALALNEKDPKGDAFKYIEDNNGERFFRKNETFSTAKLIYEYNDIQSISNFKVDKISPKFELNPKNCSNLTLYLYEPQNLGIVRTHYDHIISFIVNGIISQKLNVNKTYLPLLFLIRHSLEIALKLNILAINQSLNKVLRNEHSLRKLFNTFAGENGCIRKIILKNETNKNTVESFLEKHEKLNTIMSELDDMSFNLRFPVDKKGKEIQLNIPTREYDNFLFEILKAYKEVDVFVSFPHILKQLD